MNHEDQFEVMDFLRYCLDNCVWMEGVTDNADEWFEVMELKIVTKEWVRTESCNVVGKLEDN